MFTQLIGSHCLLCHAQIADASHYLCPPCLHDLPYLTHSCPQCGTALTKQTDTSCGKCQANTSPIQQTFSLFHYKPPVNHLIKQLKFHHTLLIANLFGKLLAEAIKQQDTPLPDCIIPVPLHTRRLRERGYNQALQIAKPLAKELGIPLQTSLLVRSKYTRPQTDCSFKERKTNLRNSFSCTLEATSYQSIAIVDDVITTGTTINEAAKVLRRHGVKQVFAWSCAHS